MCIYDEYKEGHERCGKTITRGILTQVIAFDMIHYPQQLEEKTVRSIFMMMMLEIIVLQADKDKIVAHHNKLRAKIANGEEKRGLSGPQPPAANMRMLTWNDDLALVAQRFAIYKSCIIVYRI